MGNLNGIRSSRKLERECFRNIEVQWLLEAICIRFSFFDQRGPPAWSIGDSQNSSSYKN
ncbi:hypothetical protein [Flavobacterium sp.]|jgi:hypothetical protein|uniref:hypothetical protein n=1 Tax=Flavobacterium sp. TaxID=239 RepID=UPI0037BF0E5A